MVQLPMGQQGTMSLFLYDFQTQERFPLVILDIEAICPGASPLDIADLVIAYLVIASRDTATQSIIAWMSVNAGGARNVIAEFVRCARVTRREVEIKNMKSLKVNEWPTCHSVCRNVHSR